MPRRTVLTPAQREALLALPQDDADLARHYTLSEEDLAIVRRRRRQTNRLGFALQLCVLRYPGRLLRRGEVIPDRVVAFISRQVGIEEEALGGYAARIFAACSLLGFRFTPRIRDLGERRLYSFAPPSTYPTVEPLVARRINTALIVANWDAILRFVASIRLGVVTASHMLKRLAAYPQQNALAAALAEIGRIERTLFTLQLLRSEERRHLIQSRLNKGEARNQLAQAVFFHRLGEIRDRSFESQAHRASGLNLLVSAIVTWNTRYLGHAVQHLRDRDETVPDELLAHVWPTAWEHVNLTGNYSWHSTHRGGPGQLRPLREKLPIAA